MKKSNYGKFAKYAVIVIILIIIIKMCSNEDSTNDSKKLVSTTELNDKAQISKIDSIKAKSLKNLFKIKKDEFENFSWVEPKNMPPFRNQNGIYCYFSKQDSTVSNFRFVIQYSAEDWLFAKSAKFKIDGKDFEYFSNWKTDHDSKIWEWSDNTISKDDYPLIKAIANAKSVKYRLIGSQYYEDKTLSQKYINSIKNTLEYYESLGGEFN